MSELAQSIEERISQRLNPQPAEPAAAEPQDRAAPPAEPRDAPADTASGLLGEAVEPDAPAESEPVEPAATSDADAPADDDYVEIREFGQLAEYLQADAADLYNIEIPYTKDGERRAFTIGEIKDQLETWQDTIAARDQIQTQLSQYQQSLRESQDALAQQQEFIQEHLQAVHAALLQDMQAVDWDRLHRENPGEWARQSELFRRKDQELRAAHARAAQALGQRREELTARQQKLQEELLQREHREVMRAIPEWRDAKVADTEKAAMAEYLAGRGFTADEINGLTDHRVLLLARDAMQKQKLVSDGEAAKKRVVKLATKVLKPGARQAASDAERGRERAVIKAHRDNPKSPDAAADRIALRLNRRR